LDKKFMTGRNNKKKEAFDELYTCNVRQGCTFSRRASHLHTSVSALKDHIEGRHRISESTDPVTVRAGNPQPMKDWINSTIDNPLFEEALLDWIVSDYQAFTVTESWWFKRMMRAGGVTNQIPSGDATKNKIKNRMKNVEQDISPAASISKHNIPCSSASRSRVWLSFII